MAVTITKPQINVREKLKELDFETVPFQKMPSGSVIQVVSTIDSGSVSASANVVVDTGLTLSITPTSSSNKILILVSQQWSVTRTSDNLFLDFRLTRNGSIIYGPSRDSRFTTTDSFGIIEFTGKESINYLDAPSTTNSVEYKVQSEFFGSGGTGYWNQSVDGASATSTITLMEIAG